MLACFRHSWLWCLPWVVGACTAPPVRASLDGERADQQVPAIVAAAQTPGGAAEAAALVSKLGHRDPAVRAFAGEALFRVSGRRFGYRYYRDAEQRRPAVALYERWLDQGMPGPDRFVMPLPAPSPTPSPAPAPAAVTNAPESRP